MADDLENGVFATGGEKVKVCCRIRPPSQMEVRSGQPSCVQCLPGGTGIAIEHGDVIHQFDFDAVFPPYTEQEDIYKQLAKPLVVSVLNGVNGAIMAYGQTGSGKTYTMQGEDAELRGIIPRMFEDIFETTRTAVGLDFDIRASFLEIYNETMLDMLAEDRSELSMYQDQKRGLHITGAAEVPVKSLKEAMDTYQKGLRNRIVAETKMNTNSSRSHAVFLLTIARHELRANITKFSQLYLVDLAGSEKVWKTGAEGDRLREAQYINKSLLSLGNVIHKLSIKAPHIPYRDSKLTRLLQNSLGGNARTVLNINISPNQFNAQESLSTLRFGHSTRRIQNNPKANQVMGIEELEAVLMEAHLKIAQNKQELMRMQQQLEDFKMMFRDLGLSELEIADLVRDAMTPPKPVRPPAPARAAPVTRKALAPATPAPPKPRAQSADGTEEVQVDAPEQPAAETAPNDTTPPRAAAPARASAADAAATRAAVAVTPVLAVGGRAAGAPLTPPRRVAWDGPMRPATAGPNRAPATAGARARPVAQTPIPTGLRARTPDRQQQGVGGGLGGLTIRRIDLGARE